MKVQVVVLVLVAMATVAMAGRRHWKKHRCTDETSQTGLMFKWTRSGLREDGLRTTYGEEAFAPAGQNIAYKYPTDRMLMDLGLQKSKVLYDYSTEDPVAVIRLGRRGWGPCVILDPEFDTYDELMQALASRNMTNADVPNASAEYTLLATQTTDDSSFSQVVKDLCSKDHCGRPISAVYYTTELVIDVEDDDPTDESEDPVYILLDDRVAISGLDEDSARTRRRQDRMNRRQERLQNRAQNGQGSNWRQQRRQERRERRRQDRRGRHDAGSMMGAQ